MLWECETCSAHLLPPPYGREELKRGESENSFGDKYLCVLSVLSRVSITAVSIGRRDIKIVWETGSRLALDNSREREGGTVALSRGGKGRSQRCVLSMGQICRYVSGVVPERDCPRWQPGMVKWPRRGAEEGFPEVQGLKSLEEALGTPQTLQLNWIAPEGKIQRDNLLETQQAQGQPGRAELFPLTQSF